MISRLFLVLFLLASSSYAKALGSWNILNIKYNYTGNWSFFAETQLRSLRFYNHFHYYEYKVGVNYKAH